MPVTARLSLRFYEKLGEDVANELVEWFNSVDATYRADLRELNELNFARFDAKLEQRIGTFEAKVEQRLGALDQRIGMLEARLEQRIGMLEAKLEQRLAEFGADLRMEIERRFAQVDAKFETLEARLIQRLESRIGEVKHEMLRWMLASWSTMMLVLLGTLFAVLKAR
jgi:tetrahydromethanopterin S-methyltransferase subunit G